MEAADRLVLGRQAQAFAAQCLEAWSHALLNTVLDGERGEELLQDNLIRSAQQRSAISPREEVMRGLSQ